ncbi:MAG: serine/threonine protein kinase [Deltaproteobacteria bacterium]|nr:serine/threonine protein kinase [Deltaproteobacteria bacterium]
MVAGRHGGRDEGRPVSSSGRRSRHAVGASAGSPFVMASDDIQPGTMVGDYLIEGLLDEGGMGVVYRAVHPVIGKKAAIKVLHPHVATQDVAVARFIQEARAVNAIRHSGIVDIFGFGQHVDGRQYIVMEFLEGQHLLDYLDVHGPLKAWHLLSLVRRIAEPLAAAHAKGIIHRDLKPENVFLLSDMSGAAGTPLWPPRIKLLDFGLAKLIEARYKNGPQTRTGSTVGTPYYMAPEQCRGRAVDARTDVYALGVMMYEMLSGRVPFYADAAVDVLYMHLNEEPEPLHVHVDIPQDLEGLVMECLQKPADLRPASMNSVIARLDAIEEAQSRSMATAGASFEQLVVQTAELLADPDGAVDLPVRRRVSAAESANREGQRLAAVDGESTGPVLSTLPAELTSSEPSSSGASSGIPVDGWGAADRTVPEERTEVTQPVALPFNVGRGPRSWRTVWFVAGVGLGVAVGVVGALLLMRFF